ncbi:MAG: peptidyl-prolyl cis-trans isomerase [Desulfuromonadales bacterium]|nr:peptidyl-prolyl cis-trans isomerase [Desulfuromonadales bacterium]
MRIYKMTTMVALTVTLIFCENGWGETKAKKLSEPAVIDSGYLAVIDGKTITPDIFRAEMARRRMEFNQEKKEELLNSIVRSELLFAAARTAGYENDPEVIETVKQAMVGKYLRDNLDPKLGQLKATDQEAEAYYQTNRAEFTTHAMIHAAIIKIAVSPKSTAEKKAELLKRAEEARAEALALEPGVPAFGSVAIKYSEDQSSRYRGGDIGWLQVGTVDGRWDRAVADAITALKTPGQITPVITTADGFYIAKLTETKGATVKPFAMVKDGVRYQVVQDKKQKIEHEFIEQLKSRISVNVNRGLLETIDLPVQGKQAGPPALPAR